MGKELALQGSLACGSLHLTQTRGNQREIASEGRGRAGGRPRCSRPLSVKPVTYPVDGERALTRRSRGDPVLQPRGARNGCVREASCPRRLAALAAKLPPSSSCTPSTLTARTGSGCPALLSRAFRPRTLQSTPASRSQGNPTPAPSPGLPAWTGGAARPGGRTAAWAGSMPPHRGPRCALGVPGGWRGAAAPARGTPAGAEARRSGAAGPPGAPSGRGGKGALTCTSGPLVPPRGRAGSGTPTAPPRPCPFRPSRWAARGGVTAPPAGGRASEDCAGLRRPAGVWRGCTWFHVVPPEGRTLPGSDPFSRITSLPGHL